MEACLVNKTNISEYIVDTFYNLNGYDILLKVIHFNYVFVKLY
jgi:hypothetical protein